MPMVINFIAFQLGWFACVLGGAYQQPWLGSGLALLLIALHLYAVRPGYRELALIIVVGVLGTFWDSLLVYFDFLIFPSGTFIQGIAPHWIIAMWLLFATTLNVSLHWLKQRLLLASVLGAVGGPLAYYAGHRLGGVSFSDMNYGLLMIALGWSLIMPSLMMLADLFDPSEDTEETAIDKPNMDTL